MLCIDKNQFSILCQEPYDYYLTQQVRVILADKSYTYDISFIDINDTKHDYPLYDGKLQCQMIKDNPESLIIKIPDQLGGIKKLKIINQIIYLLLKEIFMML